MQVETAVLNGGIKGLVPAQFHGPPATIPTPTKSLEYATWNCAAIKAPDDSPDMDVLSFNAFNVGKFTSLESVWALKPINTKIMSNGMFFNMVASGQI